MDKLMRSHDMGDDVIVDVINYKELNIRLTKMSSTDFFLTLHSLIKYQRKQGFDLMSQLSDENVSRILYDTLYGINIVEDVFYMVILPAFIHCIRNLKQYLISPSFRILNYFTGNDNDMMESIRFIASDIVAEITADVMCEYLDIYDENCDYIEELIPQEEKRENSTLWSNMAMEMKDFFHPFIGVYFIDERTNLGDTYGLFKSYCAQELIKSYNNVTGVPFNFNEEYNNDYINKIVKEVDAYVNA